MESCKSEYCKCLYYSANALSRVITKMADEEFYPTGMAPSYAFLLLTIDKKEKVHPKEISEQMMLTPSTITRLIEKMEYRGFVERNIVGKNTEVTLTKKAKDLIPTIMKCWTNLYSRYSDILGEEDGITITEQIYNAAKKLED